MTIKETNAAFDAVRKQVDATGYGHWVSDEMILSMVRAALAAAERERHA